MTNVTEPSIAPAFHALGKLAQYASICGSETYLPRARRLVVSGLLGFAFPSSASLAMKPFQAWLCDKHALLHRRHMISLMNARRLYTFMCYAEPASSPASPGPRGRGFDTSPTTKPSGHCPKIDHTGQEEGKAQCVCHQDTQAEGQAESRVRNVCHRGSALPSRVHAGSPTHIVTAPEHSFAGGRPVFGVPFL